MRRVLVTGAAGFIGAHVARALQARGDAVFGLDSFDAYYAPSLKRDRVAALCPDLPVRVLDIADAAALDAAVDEVGPTHLVHLAAQAGVRYSITRPQAYLQANLVGFGNVIEACRRHAVRHLVYASSSSVYGAGTTTPFSEDQRVDAPLSLYAATKHANELMAHSYAHLYRIPTTGLRFFTVYGPWGRPDMAPLLFARAVLAGRPIQVFNHGRLRRDFTHIDDIVGGVLGALDHPPDDAGVAPHRLFNLGNSVPVELERFIAVIEQAAGRAAVKDYRPMQPGDMLETAANTAAAEAAFGFRAGIAIEEGLPGVVEWCRTYYGEDA
ncbi:NAD-dependent epimerase/dehydratase family protein [Coralloluteibacterium stylophorae]|uniref:NAD-dependent epimerase/dehydratase family protein n=1 Tax=Coralloluteibacterium stylophorae TaxID=1776034 RepID=A0A8J7VTZ8_9GAMM|nr:NAD-dependent epimerase/dehydratase family protein [Coralloluteibacterium stylophorae]MBS7457079.1 NAD-dependent epimerase/dehydratase family protein [Coralloluteibacterium stylophorae]